MTSTIPMIPAARGQWVLPEDLAAARSAARAGGSTAALPAPRRSVENIGVENPASARLLVGADRGTWQAPPPRPARIVRTETSLLDPDLEKRAVHARAAGFADLVPVEPGTTADTLLPVGESWFARLRRPAVATIAAGLVMLGAGAPTFGDDMKSVNLQVDGAPRTLTTDSATVVDALAAAGIPVNEHDVVAPAITSPIADGESISIRRGRLITADVDGTERKLWTTATSVDAALRQLGLDNGSYQIAADRSRPIGPEGLTIAGHRLHAVTVVDGAGTPKSLRSPGTDVAGVLAAQGISLAKADKVTPAATAAVTDGTKIVVTRIAVKNRSIEKKIARPADVKVQNASLGRGDSKVTNPGRDGLRRLTIARTTVNGKASEKVVANTVLRTPQARVVQIGTKETGAPESWSVPWDRMAFCESTSRWHVNTGNGTYGGLQFKTPTWLEYGGGEFAPRADLATEAQQIIVAERLYAKEGLAPWHCARLLGWGFGKYQG